MTSPRQYRETIVALRNRTASETTSMRSSGAPRTRHAGDDAVPALVAPRRGGARSREPLLQDLQRSRSDRTRPSASRAAVPSGWRRPPGRRTAAAVRRSRRSRAARRSARAPTGRSAPGGGRRSRRRAARSVSPLESTAAAFVATATNLSASASVRQNVDQRGEEEDDRDVTVEVEEGDVRGARDRRADDGVLPDEERRSPPRRPQVERAQVGGDREREQQPPASRRGGRRRSPARRATPKRAGIECRPAPRSKSRSASA